MRSVNNRSLEQEIERLNEQLRTQQIRAADDLHKLQVFVVKKLRPEIQRMRDVLTANSRIPAKTHIVEAYGRDTLNVISSVVETFDSEMSTGSRSLNHCINCGDFVEEPAVTEDGPVCVDCHTE